MTGTEILGVSGELGSFSEEAAQLYSQKTGQTYQLDFLVDMDGVLAAVSAGRVDIGIFPVFNNRGGLVTMAFEAMGKYLFTWLDQLPLTVNQCLMTHRGSALSQITQIVSHPQGFAQCELYLQQTLSHAQRIPWQDTAKAARDLANHQFNDDCAVIASKRAAQIYGLDILAENIQDLQPNITTFVIIKKRST